MKFTTSIVSLVLAAASGARALPGSSLEARQARRIVSALFYDDNGCNGNVIGGQDFIQNDADLDECVLVSIPQTISCSKISFNNATRPLWVFNVDNCSVEGSNHFEVPPGAVDLRFAQDAGSAQFH